MQLFLLENNGNEIWTKPIGTGTSIRFSVNVLIAEAIINNMYRCINKCGRKPGSTSYWIEPKAECPYCGAQVVLEPLSKKPWDKHKRLEVINRWPKRNHVMDVGIDRVPCPTRQHYLDACKKARVMRPGKGGWEYREIIPAGVMDG